MPELPEVETVARDLNASITGATIRDVSWSWDRTIRHPTPPQRFADELRGARITRVDRRAKSVLIHLDDGRVISVALRMSGSLLVVPDGTPEDRYVHVTFHLTDGRQLRFRDVRKFGRIGLWQPGGLRTPRRTAPRGRVAEEEAPYRIGDVFARHGPEPLGPRFSASRFAARLHGRRARLKTLLLDQSFVAGIGNIYADEALWRARLHPLRSADTLRADEIRRLHRSIRSVLRQAVRNRGSSVSTYVAGDGRPGANQERLVVYRRTGEPCPRCRTAVERVVVGQRSTHFCPRCQPAA